MTKFCPECGAENEDVAVFCSKCGQDLKDIDQRMKSDKHTKNKADFLRFFNNFGTKQLIGLILIILGIYFVIKMAGGIIWVILIIIGAYLLLNRD